MGSWELPGNYLGTVCRATIPLEYDPFWRPLGTPKRPLLGTPWDPNEVYKDQARLLIGCETHASAWWAGGGYRLQATTPTCSRDAAANSPPRELRISYRESKCTCAILCVDILAEREWTASNDARILHSFTRRKDRGGRLILAVRPIPPLPASTSDVMDACH